MKSINEIYNNAFYNEIEKQANMLQGLRIAYTGGRQLIRKAIGHARVKKAVVKTKSNARNVNKSKPFQAKWSVSK